MTTQAVFRLSLFALLLALLAGCTRTRAPGPYVEVPAGSFIEAWRADLKLTRDEVVGSNIVGNLLIIRTKDNVAYALSPDGGTLRWAAQITEPRRRLDPPVAVNDKIVFSTAGKLIVLNTAGKREREVDLGRLVRSGLAVDDGAIYLGFDNGGQSRLGRVSITEPYLPVRWELLARGAITATPATFQGSIYSGSEDGNVYAVTEDRKAVWPLPGNVFATGGAIVADLKADETAVFVASTDSKLYALDRNSGKIRWQYFAERGLTEPPVVIGDSIYLPVPKTGVVALDKVNGDYNRTPRWTSAPAVAVLGADAKNVFLLTNDGAIFAVDKMTGTPVFTTKRDDLVAFTPVNSTPLLFAATRKGVVLGIRPVTQVGTVGQIVAAPTRRSGDLGG